MPKFFFSTIYSKYAVFSFFSMIHEYIPGYATHALIPYMYENTHAYRENIFVVFFFSSLFLKTTSPVHYCRCSLITRMPWYCKPVKISIYIYIPLHTFRSIQLTTLVPDVAVPIFTHSFSLSFFFSFFFSCQTNTSYRSRVRYLIIRSRSLSPDCFLVQNNISLAPPLVPRIPETPSP